MVLSTLQSRLQSIQNNLHSSPSYKKGQPQPQPQAQAAQEQRRPTVIVKKMKGMTPLKSPAVWSNSFLDELSGAGGGAGAGAGGASDGLIDLESDEDEGIWPNEWPSDLVSP
jgi:hypothetical protein